MNHQLLQENEAGRLELPLRQLLCFVMFCVWQMGIIYYIGPSLNLDGRTPLPIPEDNLTVLIVAGYVLSIGSLLLFPRAVIRLCRISTGLALLAALGLFLPLEAELLRILLYVQGFCCCFMIGFESATMCHYLSTATVTRHLLLAYPLGYCCVAFIQNDLFPLHFSHFRLLSVLMLGLLLLFYLRFPEGRCIRFVSKRDGLTPPRRFLQGFGLLAFLSALLGVIAPAAAAGVEHGVSMAYLGCAAGSLLLYALAQKSGRHPICFAPLLVGLSAVGYVLLVLREHLPFLGLPASVLMGLGMASCALLPLFALLVIRQYPSRTIVPGYIGLAMLAVIVQSVLVELFRGAPALLNLAYLLLVVVLALLFLLLEPLLLYAMRRDLPLEAASPAEAPVSPEASSAKEAPSALTAREQEIAALLRGGYSNGDIARLLQISPHTAKDHTKNIYRKLQVHSRFELAARMNEEGKT